MSVCSRDCDCGGAGQGAVYLGGVLMRGQVLLVLTVMTAPFAAMELLPELGNLIIQREMEENAYS